MNPLFRVAALGVLLGAGGAIQNGQSAYSQDTPPFPDTTRTIQKGLQHVEQAGERWIERRGCVSCHQVPTLIWSHQAARQSGVPVRLSNLAHWGRWSTDVVNFVKPAQKADVDHSATMASNIDTMTQLLLAMPRASAPPGQSALGEKDWRARFAQKLLKEQSEDGSWRACGQLPAQRRPTDETTATTTAWTALALMREPVEFDPATAVHFIDSIEQPKSAEYLATRLLLAHQMEPHLTDQPPTQTATQRWQAKLLKHQNDDGGWGWKLNEGSDALGTGYALHALAISGADSNALEHAAKYLVTTQEANGRWKVPGTKASAKGATTPTADDWGSAWAVIALSTVVKQDK
ncbi:triterpenes biosynthesis [Rhodopirellula islandica]|uniref:Triterpenes biosynthesis n=1 Tax=Rhodopirellula islandica TaxID=595434 RepID=A0A0J1BLV9_RHOIS|nr:prenyltransferase/squalene oxidase repeat-containing protein [Rhodopirellula islandica]KLU07452.1 triterpenes biosynthesis [Rhodopirellula islandica]